MKHIPKVLTFICLMCTYAGLSQAKEWRGLTPLHSTLADVERLLGPPVWPGRYEYNLKNEDVSVLYAEGQCHVPPDTILAITVTPRNELKLSKSGFDLSTFKIIQRKNSHTPWVVYNIYVNEEEGINIVSEEGRDIVLNVTYEPTAKDMKGFRCS